MSSIEPDSRDAKADGSAVLESVRRLESELEDRQGVEEAAAARLADARAEAESIVREARAEAEREAAEHRRLALAHADQEAERLLREAREEAGELSARAAEDLPAAARDVVAMLLPRRGG